MTTNSSSEVAGGIDSKIHRRRFLRSIGGGSAMGFLAGSRPVAADCTASIQPVFSYPTLSGVSDDRHERTVTRLLRDAVPGSSVYFTIFTLTRENIAQAFIDAQERGVDVNILIDEQSAHHAATRTLLNRIPATSIVSNGGVGDRHNHNKFLLVERLKGGDQNVVWQSSSNFTNAQLYNHNSSIVARNDTSLYDAYAEYWHDLANEEFSSLSYNRTVAADTATVFFSPRDDFDTHIRALERIVPTWDAKIHFLFSIWTESRELESRLIGDRLAELIEGGCEVKVIIQQRDTIPNLLTEAGAEVVKYPDGRTGVHSKNMLIDADFETEDGSVERRREVWTGSQNLSRPGVRRNDDIVLRFVDEYVYEEFLDDWQRVLQQANRANSDTPREEAKSVATDKASGSEDSDYDIAREKESDEPEGSTGSEGRDGESDGGNGSKAVDASGLGLGSLATATGIVGGLACAKWRRS